MGAYTLEQTLSDQEAFVKDILNTHEELRKYHKGKPAELFEAMRSSCLKGIREGVNAFIESEKGESKNLFDYDIIKFFYNADIKTPVCRHLTANETFKKHFTIKGVKYAHKVFSEDIGQIIHDEYRWHAETTARTINPNE